MPNGDGGQMMKAQQQAHAAFPGQAQTSGRQPAWRDGYANHIEVVRREHDAVIRFSIRREDYGVAARDTGAVVTEITVPLGALEGLA